jgi:hypothetical protein
MPILRKNNEKLLGDVEGLKGTVGQLQSALKDAQESMAEFKKYHDETAKRSYEAALRDLKKQKVEAIREGDAERVVAIDDAVEELNASAPKPLKAPEAAPAPAAAAAVVHPDYSAWEKDNASWLAVPEKQAYASSVANYVKAMHGNLTGRAFLDKVTEEVAKRFNDPASTPTSKVDGGSRQQGRSGSKSYNDLPAEAKAACDRMAGKLVGENRAFKTIGDWRRNYAAQYDWS